MLVNGAPNQEETLLHAAHLSLCHKVIGLAMRHVCADVNCFSASLGGPSILPTLSPIILITQWMLPHGWEFRFANGVMSKDLFILLHSSLPSPLKRQSLTSFADLPC